MTATDTGERRNSVKVISPWGQKFIYKACFMTVQADGGLTVVSWVTGEPRVAFKSSQWSRAVTINMEIDHSTAQILGAIWSRTATPLHCKAGLEVDEAANREV